MKIVQRFEEIDSMKDKAKLSRPATAINPKTSLDVLQSFVEIPETNGIIKW